MKLIHAIPVIAVITVAACKKSDSSTPAPATLNTTKITASPVTQQDSNTIHVYPFTDTFAGSLAVSFDDYGPDNYYNTQPCKFFVQHVSHDLAMVWCTPGIQLERWAGTIIYVYDSVIIRPDNAVDSGAMQLFPQEHDRQPVYKNVFAFAFSGNTLTVSWDVPSMPLAGACDWGESKGLFTGTLKRTR